MPQLDDTFDTDSEHEDTEEVSGPEHRHVHSIIIQTHNVIVLVPLDVVESQQALTEVQNEVHGHKHDHWHILHYQLPQQAEAERERFPHQEKVPEQQCQLQTDLNGACNCDKEQ